MKNLLKATLYAAIMIVFAGSIAYSQGHKAGGGRLAGTWEVQVSVVNCETQFPFVTFPALATFNDSGTVIVSEGGTSPALKAPAHGVWDHTTGRNYRFKTRSFTFNEAGQLSGWIIIKNNVLLNRMSDEFTALGTAGIFLPNGMQVATGCSSLTATRLDLD